MKTPNLVISLVVAAPFLLTSTYTAPVQAASQDECAIWLCLPGGFPSGCGGAYSAFKKRIKKGKSPLPSWSSCSVDDAGASPLTYRLGYEPYMPCQDGYRLVRQRQEKGTPRTARCVSKTPTVIQGSDGPELLYPSYPAVPRSKPSYVEYFQNGQSLGARDDQGNLVGDGRYYY